MKLPDKSIAMEEVVAQIPDGATVLVGGFGVPGTPFALLRELARQGQRDLVLVKNDANEAGMGIDHLIAGGQVRKLIVTHLGLNANAIAAMNEGRMEVEFCAQGILAERIRAGGAGLGAILTDIGIDTELAQGKQVVEMNGRPMLVEPALRGDVALVHAARADCFGNLAYAATARNFNPLMAMAATRVIAETEELLPLGGIDPDAAESPGAFIDHVVKLDEISEEYGIVRR
ncbi:acetate CoA/acetoacetate CoA-transferase alpha subunit [Thioclava sp. ES.031]|uniref:CoA transferase subunit A n=1 Tax=unclassified Thioclava TaxID=2621713 RepID=UPI000998AFE2|nr:MULTISPECIES: CoA transferase subunit A [unclassified Thioclava]MPQ92890.1 CoA transferase subunit A [Thioclava sp. JE_KL1]OOY09891.1 acetate CoA-transferase [Thioclava sp. F36-7]OOY16830.1 acetate CoA-transferase [Thioclava sp. DLFJ4-1]OOY19206.1 acetate CoA-transferase [Thioclava sp. DLFJ5-1]OOY31697.1 acetate CoA-transferase [Thioclava sp. F36-6]